VPFFLPAYKGKHEKQRDATFTGGRYV